MAIDISTAILALAAAALASGSRCPSIAPNRCWTTSAKVRVSGAAFWKRRQFTLPGIWPAVEKTPPESGGLLIQEIGGGSAAEAAGLRGYRDVVQVGNERLGIGGDFITAIDGKPVTESGESGAGDCSQTSGRYRESFAPENRGHTGEIGRSTGTAFLTAASEIPTP